MSFGCILEIVVKNKTVWSFRKMESCNHIRPFSAWAFSVGTSVGWGAFFITSSTYLSSGGVLGSVLGLAAGAVVMLFVSRNYRFLMDRFPSSGGGYAYAKNALGSDYAFLVASFIVLTYFAMLWANETSIPLFARYFFGDFFQFGPDYSVFGYRIFLGEIILSVASVAATAAACSLSRRLPVLLMAVLVSVFVAGIVLCTVVALVFHGESGFSFSPSFVPSDSAGGAFSQILKIAFISPWAFIGFENISHFVPEFNFDRRKYGAVLNSAVFVTTILYLALIVLSVSAYPPEYGSWFEYISDMDNIDGLDALPVFYAAKHYMGDAGVFILMLSLLALIVTSLIGNMSALSRLVRSLSEDGVLPSALSSLSAKGLPAKSVWLVAAVSTVAPFFGRTAIGWIVDVTTIGSTVVYGFISLMTLRTAVKEGRRADALSGFVGCAMMLVYFLFLVVSNFVSGGTISSESYFLFSAWTVIAFLRFHSLLKNDRERVYGRSNVVWMFLLSLVLVLTLVWMVKNYRGAVEAGILEMQNFVLSGGGDFSAALRGAFENVLSANIKTTLVVLFLFLVTVLIILSNSVIISAHELEHEREMHSAREMAYRDSLTGVKSKHAYAEYESSLNREIEEGSLSEFAVVVCDVNNLKWVNDNLGHKAGDEYIKAACHLICVTFDHSPVFRTGGDEFVAILKGNDYEHRSKLLSELDRVSDENNGRNGLVVVAAGMSEFDGGADRNFTHVFERADSAMYARKKRLKDAAKGISSTTR